MQILIAAATETEILPFLKQRPAADYLITGVGAPASVYHITKRLQQIDYDLVIQAGIAGSFRSSVSLGEVVLVQQDNFGDLGLSEKNIFYTLCQMGLQEKNEFPFLDGWLVNENPLIDSLGLKQVRAVTVNTITDNKEQVEQMITKYNADVETMEGAALHFVCLQEKTPFLQLRSISNFVGERNKEKWRMKDAIHNLNEAVEHVIQKLTIHSHV